MAAENALRVGLDFQRCAGVWGGRGRVAIALAMFGCVAALGLLVPASAARAQAETAPADDFFADDPRFEEDEDDDLFDDEEPPAPEAPEEGLAEETQDDFAAEDGAPATEAAESDAQAAQGDPVAEAADAAATSDLSPIDPRAALPTEGVEEILVQGQATEGVVETATSAVSFDPTDLAAHGVEDVSDLGTFTPNLEIRTAGSTTATFFIRGVGLSDFSANAAGAVAIFFDDVPMNSPALQLTPLFDLENVSVLRGPQGTGAQRNASAGSINVITRKPSGDWGANTNFEFGQIVSEDAIDAFEHTYNGAVEMPLLDDILATRLAFQFRQEDPFVTNGCGNAIPVAQRLPGESICGERLLQAQISDIPVGLAKEIGETQVWAARGFLRFVPPDTDWEFLLGAHGSRLGQDSTLGQALGTGFNGRDLGTETAQGYVDRDILVERQRIVDQLVAQGLPNLQAIRRATAIMRRRLVNRPLDEGPYRGDYNRVGRTHRDSWGANLRATWASDLMEITSISAYDGYDRDRNTDTDLTPTLAFEQESEDRAWQFYQELRAIGELDRYPVEWEAGAFFLRENLQFELFQANRFATFNNDRRFEQDIWSWAVFGGLSWTFFDDFELEGGFRYNAERKKFFIQEQTAFDKLQGVLNREDADETFDEVTGNIILTYHFSDSASAHVKYNHGFKPGHFNSNAVRSADDPLQGPVAEIPADAETIDAFEWGFEMQALDGALTTSGAAFFYQYQDYQVFRFEDAPGNTAPVLEVINADDARVLGAELDVTILPLLERVPPEIENLEIVIRGSWLESEFLDFTTLELRPTPTLQSAPVVVDFSGNQLISSPRWQVTGTVSWPFDLGRFGTIAPRYDFSWTDDVFFDAANGRGSLRFDGTFSKPPFTIGQQAFWLHNVGVTYTTPDGLLSVGGWCRNVADVRYKTYAFDVSNFQRQTLNFVGDPRTCGGSVGVIF